MSRTHRLSDRQGSNANTSEDGQLRDEPSSPTQEGEGGSSCTDLGGSPAQEPAKSDGPHAAGLRHYQRAAYHSGVSASVGWLHDYAKTMNDPHARAILNTAALHLGTNKPPVPVKYGSGSPSEASAGTPATDEPCNPPSEREKALEKALREMLEMGELFIPTKLDSPGFKRARAALSRPNQEGAEG